MFDSELISSRQAAVGELFHTQMGIRTATLQQALKKAGRRLPPHIRKAGQSVVAAEALLQNPKLARQQDEGAILRSLDDIADHLATLDPKANRINATLNMLAGLAVKLLFVVIAVIAFLRWRGYF